jgi:hypothetical protein
MKRIFLIFTVLALFITLVGCAPSGYIKSTDGDITVSLPEFNNDDEFVLPEEGKVLIGKWNLDSITINDTEQTYENSYYIFYDNGSVTLKVGDQEDTKQKFKFEENVLYISDSPVTFVAENDILTITTADNKIHKLTKMAE